MHRNQLRVAHPDWHNAPVPSFGPAEAWLAIVGLAPGERGANRTGRPFTGDGAGAMLYGLLTALGLARGTYGADANDGLVMDGVRVTNALRCLPPGNRPAVTEIHACRPFLADELRRGMPNLRVVVALGQVAHQSAVKALGGKLPRHRFEHGALHRLHSGHVLLDSYHCSRLNQNIGRLTADMLRAVLETAIAERRIG